MTRGSRYSSNDTLTMGGCVGTTRHGSGGRGSRRPSAFSESTSSALHTTHTKNKPLRRDKIRWKSDIPLTNGQLQSKRDEFWDTAPAFEGKQEIWNALKAATEAAEREDFELAQAIIDGAGISMPNGTLVECYDELGTRYTIPVYCLSFPVNLVTEERGDRDSPAEFSEPVAPLGGHEMKIRVRISLTGDDIVMILNSAETIVSAKRKLQAQDARVMAEPSRQRWYYGGKLLGDKLKLGDAGIPSGYVVQCIISHIDFDVIQTKE